LRKNLVSKRQLILDTDPGNDSENVRILVDVVDEEPVARILEADEDVALKTYEE